MLRSSADVAKSAIFIKMCVNKIMFRSSADVANKAPVYDREDLVCYAEDVVYHGHGFALISMMFMVHGLSCVMIFKDFQIS